MAWFFYALGAAILWGFSYALSEKVMKESFSPIFIMVVTGFFYFIMSLILAYTTNNIKPGLSLIFENKTALINLFVLAACFVSGAFLVYYSISLKNATLVNLIEITYPIFTLLFAYVLMKEVQINAGTLVGGLLIFSGIAAIYFKS